MARGFPHSYRFQADTGVLINGDDVSVRGG